LWGSEIAEIPPTVDYNEIVNPETSHVGVGKWTKSIVHHIYSQAKCQNDAGFCFVENVPPTPEATKDLIEHLAFIMPSHYGGFWDFTSDLSHSDTAYTPLPLPAHTDTTYYSQSAGLQLFVRTLLTCPDDSIA
jgi:trimethyllysine dioxygenase